MSKQSRPYTDTTGSAIEPLQGMRSRFDVPEEVAYFNCANLAPRLRSVSQAGLTALQRMAEPWTISSSDWFSGAERLRGLFADLVNGSPDGVALVPSVSYGIAVAATNISVEPGSNVIVLEQQYPSNVYAWRRKCAENRAHLRTVPRGNDSLTEGVLGIVDAGTSVIAVPNCHWTDGALLDLKAIGEAARQVGAALVVDASQSLGAHQLDVAAVRPDFMVTVGYKWLLGPYGLAYMHVDEKWHRKGRPIEESWLTREGSEDFSRLVDYVDEYRPGARRFDAGEFPQFISVPMACAALSQLLEWRVPRIAATLGAITATILEGAERIGLRASHHYDRVGHLLALDLPPGNPARQAKELADRRVHLALRGGKLRISPHLHTSEDDVDRLLQALKALS